MRFADKPPEPFGNVFLEMAIPSDLSFKTPLVYRMVRELVANGCLPATEDAGVELAFEEALTNAIVHGNQLDPDKKFHVWLFADDSRWGAIIEDEGGGFGPEDVPQHRAPEDLLREVGRGILLIDNHVDELVYSPNGNRVMLVGARQAQPAAVEPTPAAPPPAAEMPEGVGPVVLAQEGDVTVADIMEAHLSGDNVHTVREPLVEAAETSAALVLDMQRVTYISSQVIGLLVSIYKRLLARKAPLVLAAVQPSVLDILTSVNMDKLLTLAPDRGQGVALAKEKLQ